MTCHYYFGKELLGQMVGCMGGISSLPLMGGVPGALSPSDPSPHISLGGRNLELDW